MNINLKNYTSMVPAVTSMGRIEQCLVKSGATDISKKYEDGICKAITVGLCDVALPLLIEKQMIMICTSADRYSGQYSQNPLLAVRTGYKL